MNEQIIGTCSICGGPVYTHVGPWHGVIPPPKWCGSCGAKPSYGPTIPMKPGSGLTPESEEEIRKFWKADGYSNDNNV